MEGFAHLQCCPTICRTTKTRATRLSRGGALTSKPTWSNIQGCSATSAFLFACRGLCATTGRFFLHHPFDADVASQFADAESFAEIFWEDKLMPFIGGVGEAKDSVAKEGIVVNSAAIYRCPDDTSIPTPYINPSTGPVDGIAQRTSYLMNSQLSHKTRRYGLWKLAGLQYARGLSNFICFVERDASQFVPPSPNDPRQDDYDIWLGTGIFEPWIATTRHGGQANYLYLDGHVETLQPPADASTSSLPHDRACGPCKDRGGIGNRP
jgi:prepilin-type processing-associated H-X9-DG protein